MRIYHDGNDGLTTCEDLLTEAVVLAWDPDFTKLTPKEREHLESAENGEYTDSEDIDWSN